MPITGRGVFEQFSDWIDETLKIDDLDLMTLKGHLMVEDALKYLLAAKLRPRKDPEAFAAKIDIRAFEQLARLALVDEKDGPGLLGAVRALNGARNKMSHWIGHPEFLTDLNAFVERMRSLKGDPHKWPSKKEEQLALVRRALDRATSRILHNGMIHHTGPPPKHVRMRKWESI
jgi:hypothetical protein